MTNIRNAVKAAAANGERIRGVFMTYPAPAVIEVLARAVKLDFVYLDGEHGCFDWSDISTACITAERWGLTLIARVPDRSVSTITRYLDRGVVGIVAPHIETVQDAEEVVAAAYFAPLGKRSFGFGRPQYGKGSGSLSDYAAEFNARISVSLMIESRAGLDNIADIARVPGIDYLSFGLHDLSQDLGCVGDRTHASVTEKVERAKLAIRSAGKPVREDFMNFCWINDALIEGASLKLGLGGN